MTSFVMKAGNQAIKINPPTGADLHITKEGSDWLWALFAVFGFLSVGYMCMLTCLLMKKKSKLVKYSTLLPLLISWICFFGYFLYASNLGWTPIQAEFNHVSVEDSETTPGMRQVFYAKYVVWVLVWPMLLVLMELAGNSLQSGEDVNEDVNLGEMIHSLLLQIVGTIYWVVALLIGAMIKSTYKWGPWVFAVVVMLFLQALQIRRYVVVLKMRGFNLIMFSLQWIIIWLYFICWGVSEGGNKIQSDSEAVFYGILDFSIFAVFPCYLLFVICKFGTLKFGMQMHMPKLHKKGQDLEKNVDSEPNSARNSGETAIPDEEESN